MIKGESMKQKYIIYGYNCKDEREFTHYDASTEELVISDDLKEIKKEVKKLNNVWGTTFNTYSYHKFITS
jgi:hypothetical protein